MRAAVDIAFPTVTGDTRRNLVREVLSQPSTAERERQIQQSFSI
jgi:hypothetical protein